MKKKSKPQVVDPEIKRRYDQFKEQALILQKSFDFWCKEAEKLQEFVDSIDEKNEDPEILAAKIERAKQLDQMLKYRAENDRISMENWKKNFAILVKDSKKG